MANASRTEVFELSAQDFYNTILDYEAYPEFVDGVSDIKVIDFSPESARVEFHLNLIKKFKYICKMTHSENSKVSWELESGDLFKKNTGSWTIKELGENKIEVTYDLELDFKGLVPKMVINKLVSNNLPSTMQAYAKRASKG